MELDIKIIITALFLMAGCFLLIVASIGVIRFPDVYARMHAAGKADTLGQTLILFGLMIYLGFSTLTVKLLIVVALFYILNPTAAHFLAKAAYIKGVKPVKKDEHETN